MKRYVTMLCACLIGSAGCSKAYYSFWETFGKEKRDLLRDNVESARDDQKKVADQFQSALDRLKASYGTGGGKVEDVYETVKSDYERSDSRAKALTARIDKVEKIGADLFREWENELEEITNADLRRKSRGKLDETQEKFDHLKQQMRKSERSMEPVLAKLRDNMLYLKHSLNSQAVGHLDKSEVAEIEQNINQLMTDMNSSIRASEDFIGTL